MKLSVVATLYQSEAYVEEFVRRISAKAGELTKDFEIILVDDGSPDGSLETALRIQKTTPPLTVLELSRNFGHHKAMMTGLEHAEGDLVFLIDVDLEEPPELLTDFFDEMKRGNWDVVYGIAKRRQGGIVKRVGGKIAWGIIQMILPIRIPRDHCTVRLMTRPYVRALVQHKEHMTAIGGLWVLTGFKQTGFPFDKSSRAHTSYTFWRRLAAFVDSVISFSEKPLYGVFFLGLSMFALSLFVAVYLMALRFSGAILEGWISVMVSVWGLSGLILLCLGLVGIYISRIFIETKNRPYVIVRKKYGFTDSKT
ncbi:MAG TPA: glycosyltransferase family 2 protein [bacterium]|nr:glycosyltransferase family 2 protein [bacterium]